MIEAVGDLWTYPCDAKCVTTCGTLKANGELVMGAGVALQAAERFVYIARDFGNHVRVAGNVPFFWVNHYMPEREDQEILITFPTKHHWRDPSDPELIQASAEMIVKKLDTYHKHIHIIAMPRPGCGNGGLRWADVKPLLEPLLDDRFVVLIPKEESNVGTGP